MSAATPVDPADIVTAAGFLLVVIGAMAVHAFKANAKESPRARMLKRALDTASPERTPGTVAAEPDAALRMRTAWNDNRLAAFAAKLGAETRHVGGTNGLYWLSGVAVLTAVLVATAIKFLNLSPWFNLPLIPICSLCATAFAFSALRGLYRRRFLARFPDALELVIRAVRAGVPVIQAIRTAGKELPDPVGREFRLMGDALRLGLDQDEVMTAAVERIGLADFRFFAVCLQLQRETGGPLAETLENLATIIRARRDVGLKTRALTAQNRMASKIIAMVPVSIVGALHFLGGNYLDVLFYTPSGHNILWIASGLVVGGLLVIHQIAKLED